jgi:hypothetical protein
MDKQSERKWAVCPLQRKTAAKSNCAVEMKFFSYRSGLAGHVIQFDHVARVLSRLTRGPARKHPNIAVTVLPFLCVAENGAEIWEPKP